MAARKVNKKPLADVVQQSDELVWLTSHGTGAMRRTCVSPLKECISAKLTTIYNVSASASAGAPQLQSTKSRCNCENNLALAGNESPRPGYYGGSVAAGDESFEKLALR
jgi:hypothetical protein